jgi:MFS family permease
MLRSRSPVLAIRDFRALLLTRLFSTMSLQIQAVIVGWHIYQLRPNPLLLGLIGLVEAVPAITSSFISGHIVDHHRPAKILRLSLGAMVLNALLLFAAVAAGDWLSVEERLFILYFCVFISGVTRSFNSPSVFAIIPQVVPRNLLGASAAWNSSTFQFAAILGPAVGGLVFGAFGALVAFALPLAFQIAAWFALQGLSPEARALRRNGASEPFLRSVAAGVRFAFGHKVLLSAMTLDMFSVLFGGAVAVLPIFADQVFKTGSMGLGFLRAAPSVGSVLVASYLALKPMRVISGRTLLVVVAGFGLSTVAFSLTTNFYLALLFLAALGAFDGVSMVIRSTILQLLTPENMRGRVSALSSIFITSSNEIGAFESGLAARFMGLVPSVIFGGVMTLVVVALTAWLAPELEQTRISQDHKPS